MLATHRATGTIGSSGDGFSWGDKTPAATRRRGGIAPVEAIAIGSSTGGPQAIAEILKALKGAPPRPIFVTQHMPPSFTAVLAEQIAKVSGRACSEGHDGEVVEGDRIYVAPGGRHMEVGRCGTEVRIALSDAAPENFCRPAVDPMLRSLAHVYGAGICVVILTGMGHDGLVGCERVHSVGGRILVQDAATSVVWGMPGAVANRGIADAVLPIDRIAPALLELLRHRWP